MVTNIGEPIEHLNRHSDAFLWVSDLVIDLKLQLAGCEPTAPVTKERLDEWQKHGRELMECKRDVRVRH